ncbi:MAG: hypothetical protein A2X05_05595 [Bacteroidetes bacterium GWE2_41_25]|nr:MAG: hypothetical protein A2X05_05595 [Bacteroidetes bacterium GWE2_41_25]
MNHKKLLGGILVLFCLMFSLNAYSQRTPVTGKITDAITNNPLPGATVLEKGTTNGTYAGADGSYSISVGTNATLVFSFVGMQTQEIKVDQSGIVNVTMNAAIGQLDEIVVTGYAVQRKVDLTGAVAVVNVAQMSDMPASNTMQALQGRVPGLFIETSGDPSGRTRTLLVRGVNTLGNTAPLYIIDGIPSKQANTFAYLDPNTIESIQVLKDASASSIYGSRASNGVVIVTTKKGKGKFKVDFSSSLTSQYFTRRMPVTNTEEYGRALWQGSINNGTSPTAHSARYTYVSHTENGVQVLDEVVPVPTVGGNPLLISSDTDWQDALFRRGLISSNSITISGSTETSSLLISLGKNHNKSVIKYNFFDQINGQVNSSISLFDGKIKVGEDFHIASLEESPLRGDHNGPGLAGFNSTTIINNAYFMQTRLPVYDTNGDWAGPTGSGFSDRNNPLHIAWLGQDNRVKNLLLFGSLFMEVRPIKNLTLISRAGIDTDYDTRWSIERTWVEGFLNRTVNYIEKLQGKKFNWTWSNTANYSLEIKQSTFDFLFGMEAISNDYQDMIAYKEGFADQSFDYFQFSAGTGVATNSGTRTGHQLLSYFGKVNYKWSDRYLVSATLRVDGSSRFGKNNRFGYFPAFTAGWRIDKEPFMANATFISNLKLRSGFGIVGNQEIGDNARFGLYATNYGTQSGNRIYGTAYDLGGINTGTLPSGYVATQIVNDDLRWESTSEINIGIDFGFLKETITGSFDYFDRSTEDILTRPPYAGAMGEGSFQFVNGATMANKGFELVLGVRENIGPVSLNVLGSITSFHDRITYLPESVVRSYPGNVEKTIIDHSVTSVFGYITDGIFQDQAEVDAHATQSGKGIGRLRWVDLNGDGVINTLDQDWLGTTLPDFEYGLNLELLYKDWTFSIFGQGVSGRTVNDGTIGSTDFAFGQGMNFGKRILDAWTPQNNTSSIPSASLVNPNQETRSSNYLLRNGSYFKLRSMSLGYTLPSTFAQKIKVDLLRVYAMGENFLLIRPNDENRFTGQDPETPGTTYPRPVSFTLGINASF